MLFEVSVSEESQTPTVSIRILPRLRYIVHSNSEERTQQQIYKLTLNPIKVIAHYTADGFPMMAPLTGQQ